MSSFRIQNSGGAINRQLCGRLLLFVCCVGFSVACRQDMQDQPKYVPLRESTFYKDDLSARPLVTGTVARGWLRADAALYTGKENLTAPPARPGSAVSGGSNFSSASGGATGGQTDVSVFPFPVTNEVMARGKERFQIFCAVCHGMTGEGDGMIVRRGFRRPPSYYTDDLRKAPVGHFFDVITNGWGAMPDYAQQIPVQDRWAIIAYVRALQASRPPGTNAPLTGPVNTTALGGGQR